MLMFTSKCSDLVEAYVKFRNNCVDENEMQKILYREINENWEQLQRGIPEEFTWLVDDYRNELNINVVRKILRMKKIELSKQIMPQSDIFDNVETAFMSALYMYYR